MREEALGGMCSCGRAAEGSGRWQFGCPGCHRWEFTVFWECGRVLLRCVCGEEQIVGEVRQGEVSPRVPAQVHEGVHAQAESEGEKEDLNGLGSDILRGCPAIATFIKVDERRAFTLLQEGLIPGHKEGGLWVSSREALRRHYSMDGKVMGREKRRKDGK